MNTRAHESNFFAQGLRDSHARDASFKRVKKENK